MQLNPRSSKRVAIFAGFFSQNTMVASTFGLYGIYIGYFAEEFSASRTVASTGLPIVLLTMGLVNPFMGVLLGRFSLARILQTGALLLGFGFFLASVSASVVGVLACFIIIGVGAACMGPVPCTALAASWFEESRGRAIGFVNLPVGAVLMPPLATWLFQVIGWRVSFALLAALLLALIPLFGCVSTGPYQEPPRSSGPGAKSLFASSPMIKTVGFWVLIVSVGLVLASGSTRLVHIVEYAVSEGFDVRLASSLLSVSAICAIPGAMVFGALGDRFGGIIALVINGVVQTLGWLLLLSSADSFRNLLLAVAILGLAGGGTYVSLSLSLAQRYGATNLGGTLGLASGIKLPITFSLPLLVGYLFDITGSYSVPFAIVTGTVAAATLSFVLILVSTRNSFVPDLKTPRYEP